ncbi:hypothetical protein BDV93DRAFT_522539 [Ceratobasidium sp. AG-I]|nr:hypothetical protein BDV93DRAFT_522539 [Ceratobasidium sp. AG-I]
MDGLTTFILQELAFDGDLGSNVSRLQQLISQYYTTQKSSTSQTVDDKLYAFVWSFLVKQSTVVVGTAPEDAPMVYCPPQASASRKGKENTSTATAQSLTPLSADEIATHSLEALVVKHGSELRIAVSPDACFIRITGSHIRSPRLSGPTYAVLQLITRSRREGISVVDISRQSGYDPKTCFSLVKTLVELEHIYKIKVGGAAVNMCIYKAFYDDQCVWKQAFKETAEIKPGGDSLTATTSVPDTEGAGEYSGGIQFESIDNRHLWNIAVIRARLERLLKHMPNGLHLYRNMVFALGFNPTTKNERRIFNRGLLELIKTGHTEKVWVPSTHSPSGRVLCVRLKNVGSTSNSSMPILNIAEDDAVDEPIAGDEAISEEQIDAEGDEVEQLSEDLLDQFDGTYATQSIASQIVSIIEQSGTAGMTFAEISRRLHNFDLRSITNLAARFSDGIPPAHLTDRSLVIVTENNRRERRQRVYTSSAYRTMIERDGLKDESTAASAETLVRVAGWATFDEGEFLDSEENREEWLAESVKTAFVRGGEIIKAKPGGKSKRRNPLDALGRPVIGRPRKDWGTSKKKTEPEVPKKRGRPPKRKAEELENVDTELPTKKKRGRPPKAKAVDSEAQSSNNTTAIPLDNEPATTSRIPTGDSVSKLRRPRRKQLDVIETTTNAADKILPPQDQATMNDEVRVPTELAHNGNKIPDTREKVYESNKTPGHKLVPAVEPPSPRCRSNSGTQTPPTIPRLPKRPRLAENSTLVEAEVEVGLGSLLHSAESTASQPTSGAVRDEISPSVPPHDRVLNEEAQPATPTASRQAEAVVSHLTLANTTASTGEQAGVVQNAQPSGQRAPRQGRQMNVSALRRQTEFLQVIKNLGGVVNISLPKAFSDEHQRLLESLNSAGNAVSTAPGTDMDRRTLNATVSTLEGRGLVKKLVVTSATALGATRRANIVYLPNASPESVEECVEMFRQAGSTKGIPLQKDFPQLLEGVAYGEKGRSLGDCAPTVAPVAPPILEPAQNPLDSARNEHLLEAQTAAQYVGYIPGRFARARVLHLRLLSELAAESIPASVVSPGAKVLSKDYFFEDIPVSTYCAVIPQTTVLPELKATLDTEQGKETRIRYTSTAIQSHLRPRSSASKPRIQSVLSTLLNLGCLVPVKVELDLVTSAAKYLDVAANEQWDYFRVAELVPVYRYADKDSTAPLCYHYKVSGPESGASLWEQIQKASHPSTCLVIEISEAGTPYSGDASLLKSIRRYDNWKVDYALSQSQNNYLYKFIDQTTGATPLDDPSSTRFDEACFVTSAPASAVSDFFSRTRTTIQRDLERIKLKAQKRAEEERRAAEEVKSALAAKAAQAKKNMDRRWELLVLKSLDGRALPHMQLQKALGILKAEYILASQPVNNSIWEAKIQEAIRGSLGAKQFVITAPVHPRAGVPPELSFAGNPQQLQEVSVTALILQQGAPVQQKDIVPKKTGRKSKKQLEIIEEESAPASDSDSRRRRFPWDPEYDELARDAGAVIRVRCRTKRVDWTALQQVFPGVQRNRVRQRISTLGDLPGAAGYYEQLDNAWAALWLKHRGSDQLPDPNLDSLSDFDLAAHITFLRQYIDKAALHAGAETRGEASAKSSVIFDSLEELLINYNVKGTEPKSQPTSWDFCFEIFSEEPREREFLQNSFVIPPSEVSQPSDSLIDVPVAQAAIKMTMSTPENTYSSDDSSAMLTLLGESTVNIAVHGMVDSLDMKKRGNRSKPGRKYTYSDSELTRLKGDFASSMYPDALSMREHLESLEAGEWRNVELTDEDGEVAAYLQLVSDNQLDVAIDTSIPQLGRRRLGWQSKRVDDENLEANIAVRLVAKEVHNTAPDAAQIDYDAQKLGLLLGISRPSCAHMQTEEIICQECLQHTAGSIPGSGVKALIQSIRDAGPLGLPMSCIMELDTGMLRTLTKTLPPLVYALGYDQARIVSAFELDKWTVKVVPSTPSTSHASFKSVFPRRWLDIHGNVIENIWTMAVRTVAGALMYRPSINEHALRQRYQGLFDRQELNDILTYLLVSGKLSRSSNQFPVGMISLEDETRTHWSLTNESAWF